MAKASETTTTIPGATLTGDTTGGGSGTKGGPHPKRTLEIILLFIILVLVAYNTYAISQDHSLLLNLQPSR